jgi:hypothetical protein
MRFMNKVELRLILQLALSQTGGTKILYSVTFNALYLTKYQQRMVGSGKLIFYFIF